MSNSYRIRTQIGVDKSIKVLIDQEFEYLEILSLKVLQSQIYTRQCSDYGVIIGRVSANDGFGIPNAKVSVFIPLTNEDTTNPIISDLYPYKTLSELNEDGYRYNLLPYRPSYSNHSPTGTFFDKHDVLVDPTLIEVYDKYFKYTAKTNDSGDYMIFGVPTGSQTIHVDVDLSDIGEFSLSPQDLIRMGVATPAQVAGTKFKSSANLNELPQIVTINRVIEVEPLWGQPEVCNLGVTRTDFDLTDEANITITPTSIFMGSIISNAETQFQKRSCKPKLKQGNFCSLVAGPGEILAIRQTIAQDVNGQPILETVELESGGQVIDENGTWLVDVPMNLDYIITNEFGERVLSNDPNKGIPTKGKYRFKVKWNQSPSLSEAIKRGYFLVPNVREYGWTTSDTDPLKTGIGYATAIKSYAFSLDWNDYADVQAAINCEDTFYEMLYNKVYTVSQMIDQYRKGYLPNRMITIKNILDDSCESENVKFPTNDSFLRFDIIYLLFVIMMFVFKPILILLLIISHILAWLLKYILGPILSVVVGIVFTIIAILCPIISVIIDFINVFGANIEKKPCPNFKDMKNLIKKLLTLWKKFTHLRLPNLSYPDCELCACKEGDTIDGDVQDDSAEGVNTEEIVATSGVNGILSQYDNATNYNLTHFDPSATYPDAFTSMMSGKGIDTINPTSQSLVPSLQTYGQDGGDDRYMFTSSITLAERINLFNNKAKYFDDFGGANPGGGYNRIKVTFDTSLNASATTYHYDNVVVISCQSSQLANFPAGQLISFQDPSLSQDVNLTGFTPYNQYGTRSITGTSINDVTGSTITINYSNFSTATGLPVQTTVYNITQDPNDATYAKFPMDAEYFQVITAMTYNTFSGACNPLASDLSLNKRYLYNDMTFTYLSTDNCAQSPSPLYYNPLSIFIGADKQVIVIMVRGVDPYSSRCQNSYDLSVLLGYSMGTAGKTVTGQYKLNHPIQGGIQSVRHTMTSNVTSIDLATSEYLYYESFHFQPALSGPASFSSFTSNFPSYYSSLDNSNLGFTPTSPSLVPSLSVVCQTGLYNASSIKPFVGNQNGFTIEWDGLISLAGCGPLNSGVTFSVNSYSVDNRGYFVDEIVDGGSVMLQQVSIPAGTTTTPTINGYYYAPRYYGTYSYPSGLGSSGRQIIMRSDRLPTSTLTLDNAGNSYALQQNANFSAYQIGDDGTVTNTEGIQSNTPSIAEAGPDPISSTGMTGSVLDTFNCNAMIPLGCYTGATGEFGFYSQPNDCYENGTSNHELIMENGCYITITKIFLSLGKDIKIVAEWSSRIQITFGACRDVWSHIFTNNWINGTLYAFNIKNDRFFTSPTSTPPNAPYSVYCRDTVILHPTNNFYYRSSPWDGTKFIGADAPDYSAYKGNVKNLKFPTTIMDLGPRSQFLQEIVMSDDYDGYVVKKMGSTTFTDVSEILNLLIISRLANTSFLAQLLGAGGGNILSYFNQRSKLFVDADYAQMISISSELGVVDFESANYPSIPGTQDPIYFNGGNSVDGIIGIFFSSDTQVRDFISPKRTIINDEAMVTDTCAFNYFNVFTQSVPFYQWEIKPGDPDSIFGSQSNDWYTNTVGTDFFTHKYQTLDRIEVNSRYFRTNTGGSNSNDYKGYIYSVDTLGNYNPNFASQDYNTIFQRTITVGAPYHFYFGLKKGKTSFDRFAIKWIGFEIITD